VARGARDRAPRWTAVGGDGVAGAAAGKLARFVGSWHRFHIVVSFAARRPAQVAAIGRGGARTPPDFRPRRYSPAYTSSLEPTRALFEATTTTRARARGRLGAAPVGPRRLLTGRPRRSRIAAVSQGAGKPRGLVAPPSACQKEIRPSKDSTRHRRQPERGCRGLPEGCRSLPGRIDGLTRRCGALNSP
jgi:hypothetical protein